MILRSFFLAIFMSCGILGATQAFAAQPPQGKEISDKTLKTLKTLAWQSLPSKILLADKKLLTIDKSDPSKIVIPDDEARDIIKGAYLTARAHRCNQQELVVANRDAILKREKDKNKWSEAQLQYINTLHLYTVQLLVGKVEVVDADKPKPEFDSNAKVPMPDGGYKNCTEQEKTEIQTAVETNYTAAFKK